MAFALDDLLRTFTKDAAIRRTVRMQPAGGQGATLFPPPLILMSGTSFTRGGSTGRMSHVSGSTVSRAKPIAWNSRSLNCWKATS